MAPPAGTSSMLRSRRRDATLKPNRSLDRSASRGMLYENEELRLRTININAEVEKGQNYIKKLRRENEQLKREIWNLREEYERLENYVKSREQSEEEDEGGGGGDDDENIEEAIATQPTAETVSATATVLETVIEEDDNPPPADDPGPRKFDETMTDDGRGENVIAPQTVVDVDGDNRNENACGDNSDVAVVATATVAADREDGRTTADKGPVTLTADMLAANSGGPGGGDRLDDDGGCVRQHDHHNYQQHRLEVYDYNCAADDGDDDDGGTGQPPRRPRPHPDEAVLQPHTACFDIGSNRQLHGLTVDEVVNAIEDAELREKLRTVSLTDDRCYMTFANAECLERALHTAVLRIRDVSVLLMDTGAGAIILSLTGVPETVADKDVLKCLKRYGTIIGGVERKTSRGGTTGGERYVRIRPTLGAPRYLWFGSDKVVVRQLTEHETGTMNSVARRKSFRSQIKLNLKMADAHRAASSVVVAKSAGPSPSTGEARENCGSGGGGGGDGGGELTDGDDVSGCGVAVGSATTTTVSVQNGFRFPSQDPKTTTGAGGAAPVAESSRTAPVITVSGNGKKQQQQQQQQQTTTGGGSIKRSKPAAPTTADGCAPVSASSVPAESSPLRGRRRPSLIGFRRDTVKYRGASVSRADGGDDADSDTSPICRRKLSIKGHERTEKVPWCGCWGNGCL